MSAGSGVSVARTAYNYNFQRCGVSLHSSAVLMQVCVRPPCARRRRASAGARALGIWARTSCSDELSTLRRKRGGYTGARAMASARGILNNQSIMSGSFETTGFTAG